MYSEHECAILAKHLFEAYTSVSFEHIHPLYKSHTIQEKDYAKIHRAIQRLLDGEPIQYIIGYTFFDGHKLLTQQDVLIPRPETEELVHIVSAHIGSYSHIKSGIDLCTGSGCIAIALKKRHPLIAIDAIDVSVHAILLAKKNAILSQAEITFQAIALEQYKPKRSFDFLVSNPPYIPVGEYNTLSKQVQQEPLPALIEPSTLYFYDLIAVWAKKYVKQRGYIFLEIHEDFAKQTAYIFNVKGYQNVEIRSDFCGKKRFLLAVV